MGRWMTPDWSARGDAVPYATLTNPQSLNLYVYVRDNPTTLTDPDGHAAWPGEIASFFRKLASGMTNLSCTGQTLPTNDQTNDPGAKAQQQKNTEQLKFRTLERSKNTWVIRWGLTHKSAKGGWIVQHILLTLPARGKQKAVTYDYWEAWRVRSSSRFTTTLKTYGYDDEYSGPTGTTIYGQARFYEGLTLPSSFVVQQPGFPAGALPATTVNPNLPTVDATAINKRWWVAQ